MTAIGSACELELGANISLVMEAGQAGNADGGLVQHGKDRAKSSEFWPAGSALKAGQVTCLNER